MAELAPSRPHAGYLRRAVQHAFDTGAHLSVLLRSLPESRFSGQVVDVAEDAFSLTYISEGGAWRWSFAFDDVSAVGLRLPPPTAAGHAPGCRHHDTP